METTTRTRITLDPSIRQDVAERIVFERHPGYSRMGQGTGSTDGHEVWIAADNRPWDPWPDGTLVVTVMAFVATEDLVIEPVPLGRQDWVDAAGTDPWTAWEAGYQAAMPDWAEDAHPDGTPDYQRVLEWAQANRAEQVEAVEAAQEASAVAFVLDELAQAVEIDDGAVARRIY